MIIEIIVSKDSKDREGIPLPDFIKLIYNIEKISCQLEIITHRINYSLYSDNKNHQDNSSSSSSFAVHCVSLVIIQSIIN